MATNHAPSPAPARAAHPAPKRDPNAAQSGWLAEHRGQLVGVRLLDGKIVAGRLRAQDTYTLVLEREEGAVLVYKHAVAYCLLPGATRDPAPRP